MNKQDFEELKSIELENAKTELQIRIYQAALFLENLEDAGKYKGNGHQAAQKIAEFAVKILEEKWISE